MFYMLQLKGSYNYFGYRPSVETVIFDSAEQLENFISCKSAYTWLDETVKLCNACESIEMLYISKDVKQLLNIDNVSRETLR